MRRLPRVLIRVSSAALLALGGLTACNEREVDNTVEDIEREVGDEVDNIGDTVDDITNDVEKEVEDAVEGDK